MGDRSSRTTVAREIHAGAAASPGASGQGMPLSLCREGDLLFAGRHLLVDLWGADHLSSEPTIRKILTDAVAACHATLLSIDLHVFSPTHGISGVAILGESHMSVHTWPEYRYAAIDIFMCGSLDPRKALPVLKAGFHPKQLQVMEVKRGLIDADSLVL